MPSMMIDGIAYREEPEPRNLGPYETACTHCAFGEDTGQCWAAIDASCDVFGGDCVQRKVVYVRACNDGA